MSPASAPSELPLLHNLVAFTRGLRRAGLAVPAGRAALLAQALSQIDLGRRSQVRDAARAVLVARAGERELFDHLFDRFWQASVEEPAGDDGRAAPRWALAPPRTEVLPAAPQAGDPPRLPDPVVERRETWSASEALRRKSFAELSAEEQRGVRAWMEAQPLLLPPRRTRRYRGARRGALLDPKATLRAGLRSGGEVLALRRRRRRLRPRPLVVICDVSGSMRAYSRSVLQFLYCARRGARKDDPPLEAFLFATRLTRITRELAVRDVDEALARAVACAADFEGGTRIGDCLRSFHRHWGRRVLGRGAVTLLISDGWDRGEPELLARQVRRLQETSHRLLWLNPLVGGEGYEPLTRGLVAALPYVDDFRSVRNLASLEELRDALNDWI